MVPPIGGGGEGYSVQRAGGARDQGSRRQDMAISFKRCFVDSGSG